MNPHIVKLIKGKKVIGQGVTRIVYELENGSVIKVAKSIHGIMGNHTEAILYKISSPVVKKHLGKVIHHGSNWLIMKKYELPVPVSKTYRRKLRSLLAKLQREKIKYADITRGNDLTEKICESTVLETLS